MWNSSGFSTRTFMIYIYLRPLSNIISKFPNITCHIYAYDIQLIIEIPANLLNSNLELLEYVSEIINWFLRNN